MIFVNSSAKGDIDRSINTVEKRIRRKILSADINIDELTVDLKATLNEMQELADEIKVLKDEVQHQKDEVKADYNDKGINRDEEFDYIQRLIDEADLETELKDFNNAITCIEYCQACDAAIDNTCSLCHNTQYSPECGQGACETDVDNCVVPYSVPECTTTAETCPFNYNPIDCKTNCEGTCYGVGAHSDTCDKCHGSSDSVVPICINCDAGTEACGMEQTGCPVCYGYEYDTPNTCPGGCYAHSHDGCIYPEYGCSTNKYGCEGTLDGGCTGTDASCKSKNDVTCSGTKNDCANGYQQCILSNDVCSGLTDTGQLCTKNYKSSDGPYDTECEYGYACSTQNVDCVKGYKKHNDNCPSGYSYKSGEDTYCEKEYNNGSNYCKEDFAACVTGTHEAYCNNEHSSGNGSCDGGYITCAEENGWLGACSKNYCDATFAETGHYICEQNFGTGCQSSCHSCDGDTNATSGEEVHCNGGANTEPENYCLSTCDGEEGAYCSGCFGSSVAPENCGTVYEVCLQSFLTTGQCGGNFGDLVGCESHFDTTGCVTGCQGTCDGFCNSTCEVTTQGCGDCQTCQGAPSSCGGCNTTLETCNGSYCSILVCTGSHSCETGEAGCPNGFSCQGGYCGGTHA